MVMGWNLLKFDLLGNLKMIRNFFGKLTLVSLLLVMTIVSTSSVFAEQKYVNTTIVEGDFKELLEAAQEAIKGRGMNVAHTLSASGMLKRTKGSFGIKDDVFLNAETIEFCNAKISHELAIGNPENIVLCPFAISVYVLSSDPKHVRLSFREPFVMYDEISKKATADMVSLVKSIINEAAEW